MAAGLLDSAVAALGGRATIRSAGFLESGRPVDPTAAAVMAKRGIDISGHVSRQITASAISGADLIVTMENRQVRNAVALEVSAWPKTFMLRTIASRMASVGLRRPDQTFGDYVATLHVGRSSSEQSFFRSDDDVTDPFGGPESAFEEVLQGLLSPIRALAVVAAGAS